MIGAAFSAVLALLGLQEKVYVFDASWRTQTRISADLALASGVNVYLKYQESCFTLGHAFARDKDVFWIKCDELTIRWPRWDSISYVSEQHTVFKLVR